tara:strand:- start:37 stop:405 length:369 start_codon:yes stop_codon:yes gene_type:complete
MKKTKNQTIYNVVEEISKSQEFTQKSFNSNDDPSEIINLLRQDIKTLIGIISQQGQDHKDLRDVTSMLQKIEKAKSRFVERAIDSTTKEDYHDIMPYGVKDKDIVKIQSSFTKKVGKIDIED